MILLSNEKLILYTITYCTSKKTPLIYTVKNEMKRVKKVNEIMGGRI